MCPQAPVIYSEILVLTHTLASSTKSSHCCCVRSPSTTTRLSPWSCPDSMVTLIPSLLYSSIFCLYSASCGNLMKPETNIQYYRNCRELVYFDLYRLQKKSTFSVLLVLICHRSTYTSFRLTKSNYFSDFGVLRSLVILVIIT